MILTLIWQAAAMAATISGVASDGVGVAQGAVVITFARISQGGVGPQTGASGIDASGRFSFSGLGPGTYALCVQGSRHRYVNRCGWLPPVTVQIEREDDAATVQVPLELGVRLRVLVQDSLGLLRKLDDTSILPVRTGNVHLEICLNRGLCRPLRKMQQEDTTSVWQVILPPGESFNLLLDPWAVRLTGSDGREVVPGQMVSIPVLPQLAETERVMQFSTAVLPTGLPIPVPRP